MTALNVPAASAAAGTPSRAEGDTFFEPFEFNRDAS
jgi:hypothetical protein